MEIRYYYLPVVMYKKCYMGFCTQIDSKKKGKTCILTILTYVVINDLGELDSYPVVIDTLELETRAGMLGSSLASCMH